MPRSLARLSWRSRMLCSISNTSCLSSLSSIREMEKSGSRKGGGRAAAMDLDLKPEVTWGRGDKVRFMAAWSNYPRGRNGSSAELKGYVHKLVSVCQCWLFPQFVTLTWWFSISVSSRRQIWSLSQSRLTLLREISERVEAQNDKHYTVFSKKCILSDTHADATLITVTCDVAHVISNTCTSEMHTQ